MDDLGEARGRGGADAVTRAVGPHESGEALLDRRIAAHELVVSRIGDFGRRLLIVELVVMRDLLREMLELALRLAFRELLDRDIAQRFRHDDPSAEAAGDQAVGRGARLLGDPPAGEHARDLLAPRRSGKLLDLGQGKCRLAAAPLPLAYAPVMGAARGDL